VGPGTAAQFKFTVHTSVGDLLTSSFGYIIIACIALAGGVPSALALRRFNLKDAPFDDLFKLTGGELIPPTSLLILEDLGTGANTLALQLLSRELARERNCGMLSYTNFPIVALSKMREMGWDPAKYIEQGRLAILDCYSPLAGIEGSIIHDPSDFAEITNQVNTLIEKSTVPFTLFLDSVSPIFNSTDRKTGIKFLTTLVARVKSKGGTFILTEIKGSLPEDVRIQIEAMMDGVIELSLVREGKHLQRSLWVKKISDREVLNVERRFQIVSGQGLILKQPRFNFDKLS
jgi:KaiC/GvpD/RAD55 family RecA-like ATPase